MSSRSITAGSQVGKRGFTKPPMFGLRTTVARWVLAILAAMAWTSVTYGRINIALVIGPPIVLALVLFSTVYHIAMTHWAVTWWSWRRHRRGNVMVPVPPAVDVVIGETVVGVVSENDHLVTMIELHSDPLAPTVVTDADERTVNVLSVADLSAFATEVLDVAVESIDLLSVGFRATGGFADLYQQITGPTVAPAERRSWIVVRIGLHDNLAAIDRRGGDGRAAEKIAGATCLRIADALASAGTDARPADADSIDSVNELLHADAPRADHWSYLESLSTYTGVYYADPAHIAEDAPQWWTWPQSKTVTSLVRLTPDAAGSINIAALVRYRTEAQTSSPPVSRLGPLYGQQAPMWRQFRVGYLPAETKLPSATLGSADPILPFGPAGPLVGSIGDPRDHTSVHLPLAGAVTVLCESAILLRQIALRASTTGRPMMIISDEPEKWKPIVSLAVSAALLTDFPSAWSANDNDEVEDEDEDEASVNTGTATHWHEEFGPAGLDPETVLVIDTDKDWPDGLPKVTILTNDVSCDADIELVDTDEQLGFTLRTSTGLSATVRCPAAHEERRILGATPPTTTSRSAQAATKTAAVYQLAPGRPPQVPQRPVLQAPRAQRPNATAAPAHFDGRGLTKPVPAPPIRPPQSSPNASPAARPAGAPPPRPALVPPPGAGTPPIWPQQPGPVAPRPPQPSRPPFPGAPRPRPPVPDPRQAQPSISPQQSAKLEGGLRDWSAAFTRDSRQGPGATAPAPHGAPANGRHRAADEQSAPTETNGTGRHDHNRDGNGAPARRIEAPAPPTDRLEET